MKLRLSRRLCAPFDEAFGHLETTGQTTGRENAVVLQARNDGRNAHLWRNGTFEWSCRLEEFIPLLKAEMIDLVLRSSGYEVALHAGAYMRQGRALLLLGSPGAGKTTLGMALAASGFDLLADDVVLLHEDGRLSGLPLAPAIKSGAWDLIAPYWPDVADAQVHVRPDGQRVRYAPSQKGNGLRQFRLACVAILNLRTGARACCESMDPVDVLRAMLAEATSKTERLTRSGFSALTDALSDVRCCRLTYSDLADATRSLDEFCQ